MELYFLRHGVAERRSDWSRDDASRPLTADGHATVARVAATLVQLGVSADVIVTSPLVRARQTALVVAETLGIGDRVVEDQRLAHGFCRARLAGILADHPGTQRVMLVGHEPEFSATIAEITGGRVVCKKAGLARVDVADAAATAGDLVWLLPPRVTATL